MDAYVLTSRHAGGKPSTDKGNEDIALADRWVVYLIDDDLVGPGRRQGARDVLASENAPLGTHTYQVFFVTNRPRCRPANNKGTSLCKFFERCVVVRRAVVGAGLGKFW